MTRDELEAVCRRSLTAAAVATMGGVIATTALNVAVDTILTAADAYAVTTGGITAERRAVLTEALGVRERRQLAAAVHLEIICPHPHTDICRGPLPCQGGQLCRSNGLARTADTSLVTCRGCIRTTLFVIESGRQAAGLVKA